MSNFNDVMTKPRTAVKATADDLDVTGGLACRVMGFTVNSADGGDAIFRLFNALTVTGTAVFNVKVTAETHTFSADFGPQGVLFDTGLTIDELGGAIDATVEYILE